MLKFFLTGLFSFFLIYGAELFHPITLDNLNHIQPQDYLVSEKLDGMRAYWDGKNLISKSGNIIHAPQWFLKDFPPFELDGELYTKRGDFEHIISIIKNQKNTDSWHLLKYHIFEVPNQKGNLTQRLQVIKDYLNTHKNPYITIIPQHQFQTLEAIQNFFNQIKQDNGEGIILRKKDLAYYTGRNSNTLKYKVFLDRECKIIGYKMGKNALKNKVGSLICQDGEKTIYIGSGLTNNMRENPPPLDTIITYKYYQTTKNNMPKHPVFLRIREDF